MIVVGVDAHSADAHRRGRQPRDRASSSACGRCGPREAGHAQLLAWARELGDERVWAIEDCRHLSGGLERVLLAAGERVLRVPPKLMASERKTVRSFGKSDAIDALAVARAALREPDLPRGAAGRARARAPAARRIIATTSSRRARAISGGCAGICTRSTPSSRRRRAGAAKNAQPRPPRPPARAARADRAGADLPRADPPHPRARQARRPSSTASSPPWSATHDPALLEIPGCGVITAARILAEVGDVDALRDRARSWPATPASPRSTPPPDASNATGSTAPATASSTARSTRSRSPRSASTRPRATTSPAAITEGKTHREALRALKRQLIRTHLPHPHRAVAPPPT